jgi:cystathionine gamma-lyase
MDHSTSLHLRIHHSDNTLSMSPALLTTGSSTHLNGHSPETNGHSSAPAKPTAGFGTRAIHVGSEANAETGAVIPPISLSTTYKQDGVGNHKASTHSHPNS